MGVRPVSVAVVERHAELRAALVEALETLAGMQVVWNGGRLDDAPAALARTAPDVVLLSHALEDASGVAACRAVVAAAPGTRVIVLTSRHTTALRRAAAAAGVATVLPKTVTITELADAIRRALLVASA